MRPTQLLATVWALSALSTAWLEEAGDIKAIAGLEGMLYKRADPTSNSAQSSPSAKASDSKSADDSAPSSTGKDNGKSDSAKATGTPASGSNGATKTNGKPGTTVFDPRLPAGGVQMVTPAATDGQQYFKVGDFVTFAWNYTSLSITPSAIDILATCTRNQATYTLALNHSATDTTLLWDTNAFQSSATVPLLTETYTLLMYDANSSVSATPHAGYLGTFNQYAFGMYTPQAYTPWTDYRCATCSGAGSLSQTERQTLGFLLGMGTITILSFTWFANGFGLL